MRYLKNIESLGILTNIVPISLLKSHTVSCTFLLFFFRYLNTTFIKKQKYSEADLSYGGFSVESADQKLEIGEVVDYLIIFFIAM